MGAYLNLLKVSTSLARWDQLLQEKLVYMVIDLQF